MSQVPSITLNDGNTIPQLGFGVWQVSTDDIVPAVAKALEVGYRHIDTAAIYGNEEGVGRAIAESGIPREELFVTTKLWNDKHAHDDALAAIQTSLEKLGLDYVDLYLIHWPTPAKDNYVEAWLALEEIKAKGWSKSIGVSNFLEDHLRRVVAESSTVPAVNQIEAHPYLTNDTVRAYNAEHGIATEAWAPIAKGRVAEDPVIVGIAERLGRTPAQVTLRWHLQRGDIVFPKSVDRGRMAENFALFDFALSEADMAAITGLDVDGRIGPHPDAMDRVDT